MTIVQRQRFMIQTSPVRLHTPRRRRKRQVSGGESPFYKYESDNSRNESDNEVVLDKEVCPQLFSTDGLLLQQPQHQYNVQNVHQTEDRQNDDDDIFRNIDEVSKKLSDLILEFGINPKKARVEKAATQIV
ncbi:uncharacterized protein LOC107267708 isoform X2 [Cephus cinctus]|uniref:Uncharacterized protein LOC107267708 isoform X2 n=1 Tax=Cephus cinctus TaxID=211228 RepID=A0AAJ7RH29_CEPCN|nr:uncharacterized protein LOC107267708 isoform X2 [Cephus cinctus]